MTWAYIYFPKTGKYGYQETINIDGFKISSYLQEKVRERAKKVYKIITTSGKRQKCQVLAINADKQKLEKEIANKRINVPKVNESLLNESTQSTNTENENNKADELREAKGTKKATQQKRESVKRHQDEGIIQDFMGHSPTLVQSENTKIKRVSFSMRKQPSIFEVTEKVSPSRSSETRMEEHEWSNDSDTSSIHTFQQKRLRISQADGRSEDLISAQERIESLMSQNDNLRIELEELRKQHEDLKEIHQTCSSGENADDQEVEVGCIRNNKVHVGYNVWIKRMSYDETFRRDEPSRFIHTMAKSLWTTEELSGLTTRKRKGVDRVLFSPKRKAALSICFSHWLGKKFSEERKSLEEKNLHPYLNRVTDGARKRISQKESYDS